MTNSQGKLVAIHQPNFFPWLGFFDKIARADVFIMMDNVQFPGTGGSWLNRVRMRIGGQPAWCTMPVERSFHGTRQVWEMRINNRSPWRTKLLRSLEANYPRAPHFRELYPAIRELIEFQTDSLAEYNIHALHGLMEIVRLRPPTLVVGTTLDVSGSATALLIAMVRAVGGDSYLYGAGAAGYQIDERFAEEGIGLVQQGFAHPTYPQVGNGEFLPGLSIVDALFNCGAEAVRQMLQFPAGGEARPEPGLSAAGREV